MESVAKFSVIPTTPGLKALFDQPYDPESHCRIMPAVFIFALQLNTGEEDMPIEDAQAKWPDDASPYQTIARLILRVQTAWDSARNSFFEDLSFAPVHALAAHRPMGSVNRARLAAYQALSQRRRTENGKPTSEIADTNQVPA